MHLQEHGMVAVKRKALLAIVTAALMPWAGVCLAQSTTPGFTANQAAQGNLNYLLFCSECHGIALQGADIAPPLL